MSNTNNNSLINTSLTATICKKELKSFFSSPIAYVLIVVFLGLLAAFYVMNIFIINMATMYDMFKIIPLLFLFLVPAITMRQLAEELRSGTIEFLTTKPIRNLDIVLGKYFASWILMIIALVPTLIYYITVASLGNVDNGQVFSSYFAAVLAAGAYLSLGMLATSLTGNQFIAFIIALVLACFFFMMNSPYILMFMPSWLAGFMQFISIDYHFESMMRGVIDTRDIIYLLSLMAFSVYLTVVSLDSRRW